MKASFEESWEKCGEEADLILRNLAMLGADMAIPSISNHSNFLTLELNNLYAKRWLDIGAIAFAEVRYVMVFNVATFLKQLF